ncbi:ABC transporter permease [Fervidibacillus halotolerans]|uniref:ABC transporter permease n=1 Tax=Fervidibacillus halotolerans TaxID=2980027 RepID=A0A9E8LYV8_9BACI|nr:ABC transporter permease [Fervidibacillus halotolerans]WAA11810.1 ABC transporter permease [Fervidibacillus halotolerans]
MNMIKNQSKMEIIRILRDPYYLFWSLFMPIVFYTFFTKIFTNNLPDQNLWQAHYLMSMTTFSVMGSAIMNLGIRMVEENNKGWTIFLRVTPLSNGVYFFSKMIAQTIIHILSVVVIFTAGFIINHVTLSIEQWLFSALWIIIASFPFLAIGTFIGNMKNISAATAFSNILYLLLAFLGGMWMPIEMIPDSIKTISQWLPSFHYGNGAWEIIRGNPPKWNNFVILLVYFILFILLSIYRRKMQTSRS